MILKVEDLISMDEFSGMKESDLKQRLEAIELLIRDYTNNNFQNRFVRFTASSLSNRLFGEYAYLAVGDTVQISQSSVNDGLYVITELLHDSIRVNKQMYAIDYNLVTKVEYPADIRQGVLNLMLWEVENRQKVGIKSETISRHSVTYYDQDANNQVVGYPVSLLGFLDPYMKVRF